MVDLLDPPETGWPAAPRHAVRFYRAGQALDAEVAELAATALLEGASFLLVATPERRAATEAALRAAGVEALDPDRAADAGRYVPLDARDTLARLRVGEDGDAGRFDAIVGQQVREAMLAGRAVHAFGEMVALLALTGDHRGAMRLEALWNELMEGLPLSLWCAYPVDLFEDDERAPLFRNICLAHAAVLPGDGGLSAEPVRVSDASAPGHLALLIEARRTAEQALAQRDYFLSAAAHELRTPLTGILGYVQLLLRREGEGVGGSAKRALANISAQAQRMRVLIDQLLDAAESTSGAMPLTRQSLDLLDLLSNAAARARVGRRSITVEGPSVRVHVDPIRIEQVLAHLLHNAERFSAPGRPIEVRIERPDGDRVAFAVRDHGPGIARERHARIFDRFIHEHPAEQGAGLGLGLYLTREIVEAHGGSIAVESPEDGGSRFVVTLPLAPSDRAR